ncbi:MAG: FkbM family methyltransferase [Bacteroidales bacterium]|nr:FkbM family methyltransferase [Bacteroidales bacterium]HOY38945.1 FkbM family methyltransferase [Bacteroidales bacterium]HQP03620.1 FkbM family methyltransferase [Bacteroidales bacterium]
MMKIIELLKLQNRAHRYKTKYDRGGIGFLLQSVGTGDTVLDIGAHKGGYLYFFRKQIGESGKIYAFEPQENLFQYLKYIVTLLGWSNITVENIALSDNQGETTLYIPNNKIKEGSSPGATIVEHPERLDFVKTQSISTDTLDSYCEKNSIKPVFLKIDVEGNELQIFKGGLKILQKCKPKILVEIEKRHVGKQKAKETLDFLCSLGYNGYFIHGAKNKPLEEFDFEKYQNPEDAENYCNNFIFL